MFGIKKINEKKMKIDCISDLHGFYPRLEGGDLLIVAGDLTARDEAEQHTEFSDWLDAQGYSCKIVTAGNHDNNIDRESIECLRNCYYLCDSGTKFTYHDGENLACTLKIWGSPWTKTFRGMNPRCKAFTCETEKELAAKFSLIPDDIDILITHSPPNGIMDAVYSYGNNYEFQHVGSESLRNLVLDGSHFPNLKMHVYGHIHEFGGNVFETPLTKFVNASHVNEKYQPTNKPIRIEL